jgi:hypothetical protein
MPYMRRDQVRLLPIDGKPLYILLEREPQLYYFLLFQFLVVAIDRIVLAICASYTHVN